MFSGGSNINDEWEMEESNLGGRVTNMILDKMDNVVASNTSSLDYYAPLVKNQQVSRYVPIKQQRHKPRQVSVSFNNSVDVRVSLTSYKVDKKKIWYTVDEISSMKAQALSRKPEDQFTSEMLTRALAEAVTYPPSLAMLSADSVEESRSRGGIGSSLLKKMGNSATDVQGNDHDLSMFTSETNDVDMSSSSM